MITLIVGEAGSGKSVLLKSIESHIPNVLCTDDMSFNFFHIIFSEVKKEKKDSFFVLDASFLPIFRKAYSRCLIKKQYSVVSIDGPFSILDSRMPVNYLDY